LNIRVDYIGWKWQSAEEKAVSAGANDYEIKLLRVCSRMGFSRRAAEGAAFYTSSRLNNQG
jgi:hypothetical protein